MAVQPKIRSTVVDYYQLPEYAGHDVIQLINGEGVIGAAKPINHQGCGQGGGVLLAYCQTAGR